MNYLEVPGLFNHFSETDGIDSLSYCNDKTHWKNYPKKIAYEYNSKGFRDAEWPNDTSNLIWCLGDSFTSGVGQPQNETWPALLQAKLNQRCINLGQDGCSNDLIALRAKQIIEQHDPKYLIIVWSYFWRRYVSGQNIHYEEKETPADDIKNFIKNLMAVNNLFDNVINFTVPRAMIKPNVLWPIYNKKFDIKKTIEKITKKTLPQFSEIDQKDYARDGHHFDIKTSNALVEKILTSL